MERTYLAPEEHAYPNGGQTRRCRAICADGKVRVVWAGIADTMSTIPAHTHIAGRYARGYVFLQDDSDKPDYGELKFHQYLAKGV